MNKSIMNDRELLKGRISLCFSAYQIIGRKVFFSFLQCNGLYSYDLDNEKIEFVCFFKEDPIGKENLHWDSFVYGEWIGFVPYGSIFLTLFNHKSGEMRCIRISDSLPPTFFKCFLINDKVWMISQVADNRGDCRNICVFDLGITKFVPQLEVSDQIRNKLGYTPDTSSFFSLSASRYNNELLVALYNTNTIARISTEDLKVSYIEIKEIDDLATVSVIENRVWLSRLGGGDVYSYSMNNDGDIKIIRSKKEDVKRRPYREIVRIKDRIIIVPDNETNLLFVDEDDYLREIPYPADMKRCAWESCPKFGIVSEYENELLLSPQSWKSMALVSSDCIIKLKSVDTCFDRISEPVNVYMSHGVFDRLLMINEWDGALEYYIDCLGSEVI